MTESGEGANTTIYGDDVGGDKIGGDKITVGSVTGSIAAIGAHAQVTVNYIKADETPGIWVGVPPMPQYFVGRDELVQDLVTRLIDQTSLAMSVEGLPGVGKTTLAVALAHHRKVLDRFKDGVLWAGLGSKAKETELAGILNRWANALGIDVTAKLEVAERKRAVEDAIGQRALLIVVDDVWDFNVAKQLRFGNPRCRHILTTRDQKIARQFSGARQTSIVLPLEDGPALQLLQELAPEASAADLGVTQTIARAVGGLPLALELLGGYLAIPEHSLLPRLSLAALEEMRDPRRRLQLAQDRLGAPGQEVALQETITLSIEGLRELERGEEAERAFYALGAFAPKPDQFSWEAAEFVTATGVNTLALLIARNLLEKEGEHLALHQVLADVARSKLADEANVGRHRNFYLDLVNEDREDWHRIEKEYGQVKWAWQSAPKDKNLLEMIWALRIYQERRGLWLDQLSWTQQGLELTREHEWRKDESVLLNNIGGVFYHMSQWSKALGYFNEALSIQKGLGNQALQANTLGNIGLVHSDMGRRDEALKYFNESLSIRDDLGDRAGQATTLNNIGLVYFNMSEWEEALEYFRKSQSIRDDLGDQAGQANALSNIGGTYDNLGQTDRALEHYNRALFIREELGDRAGQAATLNGIGVVYYNLGEWEKALEYYDQALSIREELGDQAGRATTLYNLGKVFRKQGRLQEAVAALNQAVKLDRLIQHPDLEGDRAVLAQFEAELSAKQKEL